MSKEFSIKDPLELINEVEQHQAELASKWEDLEQQRQKSEAERQPERLTEWLGSDDPTKINPDTAKSMKEYLASRPDNEYADKILFTRWHETHNPLAQSIQKVPRSSVSDTEKAKDDQIDDEKVNDADQKVPVDDKDTLLRTGEYEHFESLQKLQYKMSDGRYHKVGEMAVEGDVMNWNSMLETREDNPNRRIILSTPSAELYVKGDKMYLIRATTNSELKIVPVVNPPQLANITIDEPINVNYGDRGAASLPVQKVEVSLGESESQAEGYELRDGNDPFELMENAVAASEVQDNDGISDQTMDEVTPETTQGRRKGVWDKARGALLVAGVKLQNGIHNTREYYGDDEKGRRRKFASLAIGALALGVAIYGASKLGVFNGGTKTSPHEINQVDIPAPKPSDNTREALNNQAARSADIVGGNVGSHISEQLSTQSFHVELYPDSNIWDSVAENLQARGYQANTYNIDAVKDIILQKYHLTEEQARHLAVGFSFDMLTDEELKELGIAKT